MDKVAIGLLADVLYLKGVICFDEYESIMNCVNAEDVGEVVERMIRGDFNGYKKGEGYVAKTI